MSVKSKKDMPQTKRAKDEYNHPIIDLLFTDESLTKEEIGDILHISSERAIRDIISTCSFYYPIIATSDKKGYRRAKDISKLTDEELQLELEEVCHQISEIKSRIKCLKKKLKPLIAWEKVAIKKLSNEE